MLLPAQERSSISIKPLLWAGLPLAQNPVRLRTVSRRSALLAEWITAVRTLVDRPALRTELGENGYRAFERLWSPQAHTRLYFDMINQTAAHKFGNSAWLTKMA